VEGKVVCDGYMRLFELMVCVIGIIICKFAEKTAIYYTLISIFCGFEIMIVVLQQLVRLFFILLVYVCGE
jgi:hypothetical protein